MQENRITEAFSGIDSAQKIQLVAQLVDQKPRKFCFPPIRVIVHIYEHTDSAIPHS